MARPYRLFEAGRRAKAERMKGLHADPGFAAALSERSSKLMKRLHTNPEFVTKSQAGRKWRKDYGDYWKYKQSHPGF
jgi:hypothetical protein